MSEFEGSQLAEQVDEEQLGTAPVTSDTGSVGFPPEWPMGVNDLAVTAWGETVGESLQDRHWQEEPEAFDASYVTPPDPEVMEREAGLGLIGDPDDLSAEENALHVERTSDQE